MAKIVGIHGIGQQFEGGETLRSRWLPAIKDGLALVDGRLASDDDVEVAFYGDFFRPQGKSVTVPPFNANDVETGLETDLLLAWWEAAAAVDPNVVGPSQATKGAFMSTVQRALYALSCSRYFANLAESLLIFDLKQVRRYFVDPKLRSDAQSRLAKSVGSETRAIIAHSLGSVVAYEALCAHPEWPVTTLVTIGSPLGIPNLIFDQLRPSPVEGRGAWPGGVQRWVNVSDADDVVALAKGLAPVFGNVEDRLIDNGASCHDATRYLTSREVGDALASA